MRFQFIRWKNDITLGEMIVSEGLAENFATYLYGEDKAGLWVTKTGIKTLNEYIKPIIYDGLNVQGIENLNAYLYGDEILQAQKERINALISLVKSEIEGEHRVSFASFFNKTIQIFCSRQKEQRSER